MLYKKIRDHLVHADNSPRYITFINCVLSALLGAEVTLASSYFFIKNEEREEIIAGSYVSQDEVEQIYGPAVKVNKSYILEKESDGSKEIYLFGSGVLLEDRSTYELYVVTANHVTPSDTYENKNGEIFKVVESRMEVESLEAKVIKKDEKADLALLKIDVPIGYNTDYLYPYRGKIAKELDENDLLVGTGYPAGKKNYFITHALDVDENSTVVGMKIIGGNSGGGTYRLKDKQFELAGVVLRTDELSSLESLRKLIEGTPLEDDYLQTE